MSEQDYEPLIARRNGNELLKYDLRVYPAAKAQRLTTIYHSTDNGGTWVQLPKRRTVMSIIRTINYLPDWPFVCPEIFGWRNGRIAVAWATWSIPDEDIEVPRRYLAEFRNNSRWHIINIGPNPKNEDPWWLSLGFECFKDADPFGRRTQTRSV